MRALGGQGNAAGVGRRATHVRAAGLGRASHPRRGRSLPPPPPPRVPPRHRASHTPPRADKLLQQLDAILANDCGKLMGEFESMPPVEGYVPATPTAATSAAQPPPPTPPRPTQPPPPPAPPPPHRPVGSDAAGGQRLSSSIRGRAPRPSRTQRPVRLFSDLFPRAKPADAAASSSPPPRQRRRPPAPEPTKKPDPAPAPEPSPAAAAAEWAVSATDKAKFDTIFDR